MSVVANAGNSNTRTEHETQNINHTKNPIPLTEVITPKHGKVAEYKKRKHRAEITKSKKIK